MQEIVKNVYGSRIKFSYMLRVANLLKLTHKNCTG